MAQVYPSHVRITLLLQPKWWFTVALGLGFLAVHFGLIGDADSAEHWGGRITAHERVARWLANYAFRMEVR